METPDSLNSPEKIDINATSNTSSPMDSKDLIDAVKKQIEYYFSKENLQQDAYLNSQMDANMSVPISVVMKFAKLKALTQDEGIVRKSLENATVTIIDDRIRANVKGGNRSTIILREMPSATEEEVREIFNFDGCKPIVSMRSDIEDTWFVIMDSEEDAKDTLLDLRLKKRTFRGQSVKARLKSETMVRSFYAVKPPVAPVQMMPGAFPGFQYNGFPGAPLSPDDIRAYGFGILPGTVNANAVGDILDTQRSNDLNAHMNGMELTPKNRDRNNRSNNANGVGNNSKPGSNPGSGSRDAQNRGLKSGGVTSNGTKGKDNTKKESRIMEIVATHMKVKTHLPLKLMEQISLLFIINLMITVLLPTPNYKGSFQKYSHDEIISVVQNITEAVLPSSIKPEEHPIAMTTAPHADLLLRQRTFSIDETREQLTQGRPVQRTAIINGAVDYRSMMLGDGEGEGNAIYEEPAKKTANGTWAALVMSNAGSSTADLNTPKPTSATKPSTSGSKSTSTDAKKKEDSKSQEKSGSNGAKSSSSSGEKDKDGKRDSKGGSSTGRDKKKDGRGGRKDGKDSDKDGKPKDVRKKETNEGSSSKEESSQPSISSWGGKPTFASILAQKNEEEAKKQQQAALSR